MDILLGIVEQGLIYAFICLGLYITYEILNFPDLTVDGSFTLGAAVTVALIELNINPVIAIVFSVLAGFIAGALTGIIHVKFKISDLLSGVIMQTGLYTINLIIAGKAYVALFNQETIFNNEFIVGMSESLVPYKNLLILIPMVIIVKFLVDKYLRTKAGFLLKAVGDNPAIVTTMAVDPGRVKITGLALANGLVALSGAILAQQQRFFEITMGTGTMVMGLASVIIGMKLFGNISFLKFTTMVIFGSIVYKAAISVAIMMGFAPQMMKLITAIIFLVILITSRDKNKKKVQHA